MLEYHWVLGYICSLMKESFRQLKLSSLTFSQKCSLVFVLAFGSLAHGQTYGSANHQVTVQVSQVTLVQVSSGSVNLSISGANAVAGQNTMTTTDQSTSLVWGTNVSQRKITAQTNLASPTFTLKLLALSPTQGTAVPEITLNTTPSDLMLNIGKSSGSCQLQYTAVALASQGTGSDAHTITLSITVQ
jgi:hypothetical protein